MVVYIADENFDARFPVNFVVKHTGDVVQAPPAIIKSSCLIDITWFPFDEQVCFLKYGSWTYTARKLQLFIDEEMLTANSVHRMDVSYFIPNGEWELIATPAMRNLSHYVDEDYNELFFYLHIKRQTIYYGMNWIIPSILFLLSNVLGFTMPAECGEKITLQTTNLLSVTVFLGMVADITPPTSTSVPIIAAFFSISMVILGSSIIFTLLIINVHFRSPRTHKMSPWVRTVFLEWLPWLLLMNRPGRQFKNPKKQRKKAKKQRSADSFIFGAQRFRVATPTGGDYTKRFRLLSQNSQSEPYALMAHGNNVEHSKNVASTTARPLRADSSPLVTQSYARGSLLDGDVEERGNVRPLLRPLLTAAAFIASPMDRRPSANRESTIDTTALLRRTLLELSDYLRLSQVKMDEEEEEEEAKADWRFMAMALDRACLFFYALLSGLIPVWMFISAPNSSLPRQVFSLDDMISNNTLSSTDVAYIQ